MTTTMTTTMDNDNEQKTVVVYPERIVSLLPSITEVLSCLGVANRIVGVTHCCDYPPEALQDAQVVTTSDISPRTMTQEEIHEIVCGSLKAGQSMYGMKSEVLKEIRPDIIFTQSLCDVCAVSYPVVLETCAKLVAGPPLSSSSPHDNDRKTYPKVISMEPTNLNDVIKTFHVAAAALGRREIQERADQVTRNIQIGLDTIQQVVMDRPRPKVAFLEWHAPFFSGGHWIPDMLDIAGGQYDMCLTGNPSAPVTDEAFCDLDPDIILIGPCGFSLERCVQDTLRILYGNKKDKPWWSKMRAVKEGRVFCLDGNSYYARPGPRLLQGTGIMAACMHGEDVAKELGEDLAPSSGYLRMTLDNVQTSTVTQ